eukprot:6196440-Pleurochrysis_carterae.AAC.1
MGGAGIEIRARVGAQLQFRVRVRKCVCWHVAHPRLQRKHLSSEGRSVAFQLKLASRQERVTSHHVIHPVTPPRIRQLRRTRAAEIWRKNCGAGRAWQRRARESGKGRSALA